MAFTTKQFNDLRGILFLMLLTIPSIATTNIDCNGKPFQCVNSTHFMICVDLGSGVSSTIDSFIIPCPAPTECHNTNRFECEFPATTTVPPTQEPLGIIIEQSTLSPTQAPLETITDQNTIATVQSNESAVQPVPEIITTIPFEDLYNTVRTTTLSESEFTTTNPTLITDSPTINVIGNTNVTTLSELEVGGRNTDVLNITRSTQDVYSKTTVSSVVAESVVANTTENAFFFTPTDSKINTTNEISTESRDVVIAITENIPIFTTTENVNLLTENKTEPDIKSFSDKQMNSNLNTTDSIQNPVTHIIESVKNNPHNSTVSISEITIDQSTIANDQNQIKKNPANDTTVAVTNAFENVVIHAENTTTTLTDLLNKHIINDAVTEQTQQNYRTPETIITSSSITSDFNIATESIIPTRDQNVNLTDSIQNPVTYTIESVKTNPHSTVSISEITIDQSTITNDQNQIKKDPAKDTTVTVTNAFEDVVINAENTTTTLADILKEHIINDAVTEQTQQNYRTPETIVTSSSIPSDLNIATESIIPTRDQNVVIENKVIIDQDNQLSSVDTPNKEIITPPMLITNYTLSTENVTANNNLDNVTTEIIVTGPSSELHNAVILSTVPTIDTALNTETTTLQDGYVTDYSNSDNIVDNIPSTDFPTSHTDKNIGSIPSTDFPTSHTDKNIGRTESTYFETTHNDIVVQSLKTNLKTSSDNLLNLATTDTPHKNTRDFNIDKIISELRKINPTVYEILTTTQNEPTKTPLQEGVEINTSQRTASIATDSRLVVTEPITIVNEHISIKTTAVNSTSSEKQVTLETAQNFLTSITTITEPAVSESDIDFTSNGNSQTSKLNPSSQQTDSNTNTSTINSQHKLPSNMELNAGKQDMNIEMTTTEPTLTGNNNDNSIVNKIIQPVEHKSITPQSDIGTSTIKTEETSNSLNQDIVSDSKIGVEPRITSSPIVPTKMFLYVDTHTPETTTKSEDVIKSAGATYNELSNQNKKQIESFIYVESVFYPTEATVQYSTESNRKAGQANEITASELYYITDTPYVKARDFNTDKIINGLQKNESTGHKMSTATQNDQTKTPLQEKVDINTSQNTATIASDSKLVNIESIIVGYEQQNIQTTASEIVSPAVTESNLFLKPEDDQLPKVLLAKAIDISNKNKLNVSEISTEKSINVEPKVHDITIAPIMETLVPSLIETQTQLSEIEFKTQQQKLTNTISGVTNNIAEYDTISQLPVIETIQNSIDVVSQTVSPDSVLQFTSSSFNTKKTNIPFTVLNYISSPANNFIKNNPEINDDKDEIKKYKTGDLSTGSTSTVTVSGNLNNEVQDQAIESLQYNPNNNGLPQGHQTPIETIKTETKFQDNIENISQTPQDEASLNKNTVANTVNNLAPTNLNSLPFEPENINKPYIQETGVLNVENALIPTSTLDLQKIVPAEFHVVTSDTAFGIFNQEVQTETLLKSTNNNKNDISKGTTNTGSPLFEPLSTGKISKQNINPDKQIFINQESPRTIDSTWKEFNNVAVNEGKGIDADISNNTSTSSSVTTSKVIPVNVSTGSDFINKSFLEYGNKTVNFSYLVKFNKDNTSALPLIDRNIEKNITVGNNTHLTEAEKVKFNEGIGTSPDVGNYVVTSSSSTIIPAKSVPDINLLIKGFDEFKNQTTNGNSSDLVTLDENNLSDLSFIGKNIEKNNTVENNKNLSEAEKLPTPNILESHNIVRLNTIAPTQTLNIVPITTNKTSSPVAIIINSGKDQTLNFKKNLTATPILQSLLIISDDKTVRKASATEKNNGTGNTHSSIVSSKDGYQKNGIKASENKIKNLAEREVSAASKVSTDKVESTSSSQNKNKNAFEIVNLAPFDLLSTVNSGGFEEKSNKPSTEKPEEEETNESENSNIKVNSLTTSSFERVSVTTESVVGDNNAYSNNIVQNVKLYETLTSKPTTKTSTRPTQVDNWKNIQPQPILHEVSTQSTVRSTSLKLSLENNTPLPPTTTAVTNDFVCKLNHRGRFADNHDCRKFYICLGRLQPLEGICPINTVFSELRKQCTKNLSHCVRNNQFQCVSEGRFSDFLNDNIYYICVKNKLNHFTRFKLRCQNGYHLNKTSVRCALNTESSQSISSDISKSNSEQSAALKVEVKSKDLSKNKFECKEEGTFADPNSCRVYYLCKKTRKSGYRRKKKKCDSDESFHKDKKTCVDAESYECK